MLDCDVAQTAIWRRTRDEFASAAPEGKAAILAARAKATRRSVLTMIAHAGLGHVGGDLSVTDILTTLFAGVLRIDPTNPGWPERDRFVMSKGHCAASFYSTLAHCGYFPPDELATFMAPLSALNGHPNRVEVPGVETNSGPLGHGLPVGVGQAIAAKLTGSPARIFVVLGDGEMQEGSNWEALMAGAHHSLDNLTIVVDRNRLQQGARTEETNRLEPFAEKLASFGWEVREIDGHDYTALLHAFEPPRGGKPVAVLANTIKGKGVSFMEDRVEWHHKVPSSEQLALALAELA